MTAIGYVAQIVRPLADGGEMRHIVVGRSINDRDAFERVEAYVNRMNMNVNPPPWSIEEIEPFSLDRLLYSGAPIEVADVRIPSTRVVINMVQATDEEADRFAALPDIDPDRGSEWDACNDCEHDGTGNTMCACCPLLWM